MYIQPNKMLPKTSRIIKPYMCSMVAVEGPNIIGKINLSGIEIPYESQLTTKMSMNAESKGQPLMYGFLGQNITYLLIKATFDETDPRNCIEENLYMEYYMDDNPTVIRTFNKLLLLTGNSEKRIPQVYLNNPSDLRVDVEIMMANMEQSDYDADTDTNISIINIYHNNITTNKIWNSVLELNGSTQFQIVDSDGNITLYLDFIEVDVVNNDIENNQLVITTKSDTLIYLTFLSLFEMYQAYSRIEWVLSNPSVRYLSTELPSVDITAPIMIMNPAIKLVTSDNSAIPNNITYIMPFSRNPETTEFTIYNNNILNYFIIEINDDRDDWVVVDSAQITVRNHSGVNSLTEISSEGLYDVVISATDIANNESYNIFTILVDDTPPTITWNNGIEDTFNMVLPTDARVPSEGISGDDIIRKSVNNIVDNIDTYIDITDSNISTIITDSIGQVYNNILVDGEYFVEYTLSDSANNLSVYNKTVNITNI